MLLDKYVLTKGFENLMSLFNPSQNPTTTPHVPSASFTKRVNASMMRIDPLLKTLQVRPSPPEGLVQAYLIHIGDRSETNFRKILELKGARRTDHAHLMEMFIIHRDGFSGELMQSSPLLTPLMASSGLGGSVSVAAAAAAVAGVSTPSGSSAGVTVPGLQGRFDAATLGEKLLSAARDGVERMGTGSEKGSTTPVLEKANINENLKSIGNFFRRDIGGLGARFKRDGGEGAV